MGRLARSEPSLRLPIRLPYCQPYEVGRIAASGILSSSRRSALA